MSLATQDRNYLSRLLTRSTDNSAFYAAITAADEVREINEMAAFSADPRYRLLRIDHRLGIANQNEFEIILVDDIGLSVAYYNKVTLMRIPGVSSRKFAHSLVWRSANSRHSPVLSDISQKVLFNYIVQNYEILLSADIMTDDGNIYWHRQVSRAIENGLYAYAYYPAAKVLQPIPTQHALNDLQDQAWSSKNHEALKAIISTSPVGFK